MSKKRLNWLDIAKGIAIIAVVFGHIKQIPWEPYRRIIFTFHMPLFFIAAGFTAKAELSWKSIGKSAKRLLVPYGICCAIMALISLFRGSDLHTELVRILWGSGVPGEYGPGSPIGGVSSIPEVGAIWFLPCMFWSKTIFCAILFLTRKGKEWLRLLIILPLTAIGYIIGQHYKLPLGLDISLFVQIFFYAGYLFRKYKNTLKRVSVGAVLAALWYPSLRLYTLELASRIYQPFPLCIITTLGAIAACYLIFFLCEEVLDRCPWVNACLSWCGAHSMNLYLVHHFDGFFWGFSLLYHWLERTPLSSYSFSFYAVMVLKIVIYAIVCMAYIHCKKRILARLPVRAS